MSMYGNRDGKFKVRKLEVRDKVPVSYSIPALSTKGTAAILAGWDTNAGTYAKTATSFNLQPPYPVNISVQAWAAGTAGSGDRILIKGYDATGDYIQEYIAATATAKGINYGTKNFSKLISVEADDALHKSTDVNIGYGSALGLPWPIGSSGDIITYDYGSTFATTANYAVDVTYNRIRPKTLVADVPLLIIYRSSFQ